ncbi:MAG: bifunctional adenosylcobinamide kinase/adenosylcobinamide-phosphate guanylyltransferase [Deltaproteobacteria bacterium]|jgi:adenosylcobinamide kinase/adenosylcobinamide-phosphate guanylyltransferase|nr:bifunctional adenosylcobinamide kinase/adenosylcobinamide-phosphate guanylyltransferase [Deltaproteobacteria bacterium]
MGNLTLFIGGAKSGKTKAALSEAAKYPAPRIYLATAQGLDCEMQDRIKRHQAERGPEWRTLEAPLDPSAAIRGLDSDSLILMDCLTLWFSNLLLAKPFEEQGIDYYTDQVELLVSAMDDYKGPIILVSNELGSGIVPMDAPTRLYRDAVGLAHQRLAAFATQAYLVVAGLHIKLK